MAGVVRMAGEDGCGAVELFGENQASQGVRYRERTKREQQLRAGAGGVGPTVGGSDGKKDVLRALIAARTEPGRESF